MTTDIDTELDFEDKISLATGSSYPKMDDVLGCLLLIRPYEQGTRASKTNAGQEYVWVETDTVVLQAPDEGEGDMPTDFFEGENLPFTLEGFQFSGSQVTGALLPKLRNGKKLLGVLVKGEPSQKGRSAPWILDPPSDAQVELAKSYLRAQNTAAERKSKAAKAFD